MATDPDINTSETSDEERVAGERISAPRKVARISAMLKQLLEEIRTTELDHAARGQLAGVQDAAIKELGACLSPDLQDELITLTEPFRRHDAEASVPSATELHIALAQLVGWLDGLLAGIQSALAKQSAKDAKSETKGTPANRPGQYL